MCKNNYFVKLANRELEKGEDLNTIAKALENIAEAARIEGAWAIWNEVCEAQIELGI